MLSRLVPLVLAMGVALTPAAAEETLRVAIGQRASWTTAAAELGQNAGIFKKHGIVLDITYGQGGGEVLQPVASGAIDIAVGAGTGGVMAAYAKGAPVRLIGNIFTGADDFLWYVRGDSPIKDFKDASGRSIAFSAKGSSSELFAKELAKTAGISATLVATGGTTATLTAVMSGQVDVGYGPYVVLADYLRDGRARVVMKGADIRKYADQTVRVIAANASTVERKRAAVKAFLAAYQETIDWMYSQDEKVIKSMAAQLGYSEGLVREARDYYPKDKMNVYRVSGLDGIMVDAVEYRVLERPLTEEQVDEL